MAEALLTRLKTVFQDHWKAVLVIGLLLNGMIWGFCLCHYFMVRPLQAELADVREQLAVYEKASQEAERIEVPVAASSDVTAAYVPKERIVYVDAATGQTIEKNEATDVQMDVAPPTVTMKYNGRDYEMSGISGETTKFEKGKLQSSVSTNATIDLTGVIDEAAKEKAAAQQKHFSVGAYGSTDGLLGGVGYKNKENQVDVIVKVTDPKDFWGVGWRRWF